MDYRKNVTCRYWKNGFCANGDECPFLHGFASKSKKRRLQRSTRFKEYMHEPHMNEETQGDEFWEHVDDSGDHNGDSWDGCDPEFGEAEEYGDHWEGVDEGAIAAFLEGCSTWSGEAQYSQGRGRPKRKGWSGPKRQQNYPHEHEKGDFRFAKDVEKFLRRERNRIENIVGYAKETYVGREFESSRGSPTFYSDCGGLGGPRGQISKRNSRPEGSEGFNSSRHRHLERQKYINPDGCGYRSPERSRHKSTDRGRYKSRSRSNSPNGYDYRNPDISRHKTTDQDRFRNHSQTRHLTPDHPRARSPGRVRDWSHESLNHNLEPAKGRDLENDRPRSGEQSKPGRHMKSRQWSPEQPQYLSHERLKSRSPDSLPHRVSERPGHRSQERVGLRSPVRPRLRSLEGDHHWSSDRSGYRSPERYKHKSHDLLRHKNSERSTYKTPKMGSQRSPKRPRVNSPGRNQYDDMNKELKQGCTNYKLVLHRYESPVLSDSTFSDDSDSCSRSSSRNENHLSERTSKELPIVSHGKEPSRSKSEDHIQDKVSVSKVDLQRFEKRILSNCQELLASLKDPSKIGELLKLKDQQISAQLCKGTLTSQLVSQAKNTSAELSSPKPREGDNNKESRSPKEDHNASSADTSQPAYDKIKIVVDCKKTDDKVVASIDTARQVVLMEDGKSSINDIPEKDGKHSKLSQNLNKKDSERSGVGFLKDSAAKADDTCILEEKSRQTRRGPGSCNKQESSFREEEDNYESVVEEVSQELDDVLEALKEIEDSDDCEEEPQKFEEELQESTKKTLQDCAADIVSSLKEGCDVQSELDLISTTDCNTNKALPKSWDEFQVVKSPIKSGTQHDEMGLRRSSKTLMKASPVKLNCESDEKKPFAKVQPYSITYLKK